MPPLHVVTPTRPGPRRWPRLGLLLLLLAASTACGGDDTGGPGSSALDDPDALGASGLRRLTSSEVAASIEDVFAVPTASAAALLPEDQVGTNPFDNNFQSQTVSPGVIASYAAFAEAYAAELAAAPGLAERLGGCTPVAADDQACLRAILERAGRRMFRRPLGADELDAYVGAIAPAAASAGQFATAIEMVGLLLLQHPAFLYRLERGAGALDDYEIATRMAFLLWGRGPDDALLDAAAAGALIDPATRVSQAERLLADPRARAHWQRFHAMWLGYGAAPMPPALAAELTDETNHLIDRVVFERDDDWLALFRWPETYLTPALATHYGLPAVAAPGWAAYPADRGGGILTHGAFLTLGAKFGDTSPTVRGYQIFKRLTCGTLGTIPPFVDTDQPPGDPADCKPQRYMMGQTPGCMQCHAITDNIGFGLENFGVAGAWRTTEAGNPACTIAATGSWDGTPYTGPAQLGALIAADPRVSACATTQLFRFVTGRDEVADDAATLRALDDAYRADHRLQQLLLALVRSPALAQRKGE